MGKLSDGESVLQSSIQPTRVHSQWRGAGPMLVLVLVMVLVLVQTRLVLLDLVCLSCLLDQPTDLV